MPELHEALTNPVFKSWVKPGPAPVGGPHPEPGETLDPLSGRFGIYQFDKGHRYSTDDLLTAWFGAQCAPSPERVLDLGSGISSIAMMLAWKVPGAKLTTIEAQEQSYRLAQKSVAYNGLQNRFEMFLGDIRNHTEIFDTQKKFNLIMGCPPYWPVGTRTQAAHSQAVPARLEVRGDVSDYCRVAFERLDAGGVFSVTFPFEQRERVEKAAGDAGLGIFRIRPVHFKEGKPPSLGLFAMCRRQDVPENIYQTTWVDAPLVIRQTDGKCHPEYAAIKLAMGFPPW